MDLPLGARARILAEQARDQIQRKQGRLCCRCTCVDIMFGHICRPLHYGCAFRCSVSRGVSRVRVPGRDNECILSVLAVGAQAYASNPEFGLHSAQRLRATCECAPRRNAQFGR